MSSNKFPKGLLFLTVFFLVFVISGCAEQECSWPANVVSIYGVAGFSVQNRPIEYIAAGEGENVVFIMAGIHGNEPSGELLVEYLIRWQHILFLKSY